VVDIPEAAVTRAQEAAGRPGAAVGRIRGDAPRAALPARSFVLASVQHAALPEAAGEAAVRALPGTVLHDGLPLAVCRDPDDEHREHIRPRGADPAGYFNADDLALLPGDAFTTERHAAEPRIDPPPDNRNTTAVVLRARHR
jgi:hypothetical protein